MQSLKSTLGWKPAQTYSALPSPVETKGFLNDASDSEHEHTSYDQDTAAWQKQSPPRRWRWIVGLAVAVSLAFNVLLSGAYVLKKSTDQQCTEQLTGYCASTSTVSCRREDG